MLGQYASLYWLLPALVAAVVVTIKLRSRRLVVTGAYVSALIALFTLGFVADVKWRTEGWAFLPAMCLGAPWSFFATNLPDWMSRWVARSLFNNFVLFVLVCGGVNVLLYALATRVIYPKA